MAPVFLYVSSEDQVQVLMLAQHPPPLQSCILFSAMTFVWAATEEDCEHGELNSGPLS